MDRARLRIALVSTPFVAVPPSGYGGTELVVAELARALARRGHEVVVYATGDSRLPGIEIRSYFPTAQWPPDPDVERTHATWALRDAARDPRGFDVVHLHAAAALQVARLCPYPMLHTIHHDLDPVASALYRRAPQVKLVAISHSQARREHARVHAVVHHGLDPERFEALPDQGYLLFLGRYDREKGADLAVETAARAGLPLVMAGATHQEEFWRERVRPLIQRHGALDVGPVGGRNKLRLLARARAVLFPIQWDEPFGLVMIESLLSGVPVLATRRGSVPEIVEEGLTGALCEGVSELAAAARTAGTRFDRARIRRYAAQRWSAERMTDDYLRIYRKLERERVEKAGALGDEEQGGTAAGA